MEHQQPRRHRRRLLTLPRRNAPTPGCVQRLLRFAARLVIQLTRTCCTRPRRAAAPTQEPRPLTSEEALDEKRQEAEQRAREISDDSMSRYSWTRITHNRIPSVSRLATSSSSSDSWLQPRYLPEPPIPPPRRRKVHPLKRTAAINHGDVDAAAPSSDVSANPDTCTADQDIDASEISTAIHDSPESQTDGSTAATSNRMPGCVPSSEMSITGVQDMAHIDLGSSDSSIVIANSTACQITPSGISEIVSQKPPQKPPRKSRIKSTATTVLSPGTVRKEQVHTGIDTNAHTDIYTNDLEIVRSSSEVPTQPTSSLLVETIPLTNVARMTSAISREQHLNVTANHEASIQVSITKEGHSIGTLTYTTQVLSSFTAVSTQSSIPLLVDASTQILILESKEMQTVMPTTEQSNQHIQDNKVVKIIPSSSMLSTESTASLLVDTIPVPHVESSTCSISISGEQKLIGTENIEVIQASVAKRHSVGTMAYMSKVLPGFKNVSAQSSTPLLVDTCKQIVLEPKEMLTLMPTVELSQRIVNLVQNNIIIPTKGQSSPSDTAWIESRVQQLLSDIGHLFPDLTSPSVSESQEVQLQGNDDQCKDNSSSRYIDVSQELLEAMTDIDSNSSDDCFVDSSTILPDFPIKAREVQLQGNDEQCKDNNSSGSDVISQELLAAMIDIDSNSSDDRFVDSSTFLPDLPIKAREVQLQGNDEQCKDNSSSRSDVVTQELLAAMNDIDSSSSDDCFVDSSTILPDYPIQAQEVQLQGNDDQCKDNSSSRSDDVTQELLAAMTDVDSNSSDDYFVNSSTILPEYPIQETILSSELGISNIIDLLHDAAIDTDDTGVTIGNNLSGSDVVSQELLAAMTDIESNSSDDCFVDSSTILPDFPIQETVPFSELGMSNIIDLLHDAAIDTDDTGVIIDKVGGDTMCDDTAKSTDNNKGKFNIAVTNAECINIETAEGFEMVFVPKQSEVTEVENVLIESKPQPVTNSKEPDRVIAFEDTCNIIDQIKKPVQFYQHISLVEKHVDMQNKADHTKCSVGDKTSVKSSQENDTENCLRDKYQTTSSDEEDSSHKTSREIFAHVKVDQKGMNSLAESKISGQDSVESGSSLQPDNTERENCLMDNISVSSSDEETVNNSPKTSRKIFGHVNIDGYMEKKTAQTCTHTNQSSSLQSSQCSSKWTKCLKDFDSVVKFAEEDQPGPQNMMQEADVKISRKDSRERFGNVNIDTSNDKTIFNGKGKKSSNDSRSCQRQKSSEWEKCLKELREALCSDPRDYEKTRKTSRERFGHVNIDCTSNEKTQRNGMNDPNKGVHHHHSDISFNEADPSQSQDVPPDKSTEGKSVKFQEGFELPRTSHYGLNDRESYPIKSVLKRTVQDFPETDNVVLNNTSLSPGECLPESMETGKISSVAPQTRESTSFSDIPDTSYKKDSLPPTGTNNQPQEHPPGECLLKSVEAGETRFETPQTSAPAGISLSDMPGTSSEKDSQPPPDTYSQPQEHPKAIMGHDGFAYPSVIIPLLSGEEVEFYEEEDTSVQVMLGIGSHGYCQAAKYTCPNGSVLPVAVKLCFNTDNQPALMREGRMSQYLRNIGVFPEFHGYLYLNLDSRLVVGLVSELFGEGKTLAGLLKHHHLSLAAKGWVDICIQLAKGLQTIHQSHVIYNDLQSNNILVDVKDPSHPVIKFIDLGLATYKYGVVQYYDPDDVEGVEHIAPEVKDTQSSTRYSDIWALGALYRKIYDRTQVQGLNEVSKSALVGSPWGRPSLETLIKLLEGVANKHF